MPYDALQNPRVLNKFYFKDMVVNLEKFVDLLKNQITNLRSSNSWNALELFLELFQENSKHGLKTEGIWKQVIEVCLPLVVNKIVADKQFLSQTAQQGILACARASPIPETTQALVQGCRNKSLKIVEFCL